MVLKNFSFNYLENDFSIDVKECKTISQKATGLMFRKNSPALLFYFKKDSNDSIHSFFCKKFIAIWFNDGKIVDVKYVLPWKISVKPGKSFDKLLEVPSTNKYFLDLLKIFNSSRYSRG